MNELSRDGGLEEYNNIQEKLYETLTRVQIIEPYYNYDIPGREYEDNEFYQTNGMADNRSALKSFATDKIHREMVRSQYNKE